VSRNRELIALYDAYCQAATTERYTAVTDTERREAVAGL